MSKYFSREFLLALGLLVVATLAMLTGRTTFVEWAAASGGFVAIYTGSKTFQKVKLNNQKEQK